MSDTEDETLSPKAVGRGWCRPSPNRVIRVGGPAAAPIAAELNLTPIGWIGTLHRPPRLLRMPYARLSDAISAFEAAEHAGPFSELWCEGDGLPDCEGWLHGIKNGRSRWAASMYDYRYALTVLELPPDIDGSSRYVVLGDEKPIKVQPDGSWDYDHPGEPEPPEDPTPFTIFSDWRQAMYAGEQWAYNQWIDELEAAGASGSSWPGPRRPDDPYGDLEAYETLTDLIGE